MNKLLALIILSISTQVFASESALGSCKLPKKDNPITQQTAAQPTPVQLAVNAAASTVVPVASAVKSSADQKQNLESQNQHTILYAIREGSWQILRKTNVLLERYAGVKENADMIFTGFHDMTQVREIVIHNKTTGSFIKKVSAGAILIAPHCKGSEDLSSILDKIEERFKSHMKKSYIPGTILTGKYFPQKNEFTAVSKDD